MQKFSSKPVLMFDCVVNLLPGCQVPLLACAGDDGSVQLLNFQTLEGDLSCVRTMKVPGHEDWIRALAFTVEGSVLNVVLSPLILQFFYLFSDGGDLLLASAAQDTLIRVWRISPEVRKDQSQSDNSKLALQSNQGEFSVIFQKEHKFKCQLETVLQGHENWVYGLHWQSPVLKGELKQLISFKIFTKLVPTAKKIIFLQMAFGQIPCGYSHVPWTKP